MDELLDVPTTGPSEGDVVEPKPKKAKKEPSSGKGRNSGFLCPRPISEKLTTFVGTGETELPRAEAVKRIWDYIKEKGLQVCLASLKAHLRSCKVIM